MRVRSVFASCNFPELIFFFRVLQLVLAVGYKDGEEEKGREVYSSHGHDFKAIYIIRTDCAVIPDNSFLAR